MAVSKQYKRKFVYQDIVFYWYVNPDYDDEGKINVHILSNDKKFIVAYEIGQASIHKKNPFLVVMGNEFIGYSEKRTGYFRVRTPIWHDAVATPSFVKTIIEWCFSDKKEIVLVNWMGELV
ncbi:hypothetical protein DQG23_23775 [Paenibacillus contaminans]|uniref:Uncharacterized protein n=1 Tax=Paenibacillus contaminans TaxID=450362 RepID=A0A329MGL1_9BACL|nr:hypothetical protein DQG23_23775 [Paenibacillus contaminans]